MTDQESPKLPKHRFRPKARIMVLLGEQLIKNHTLALFELVKNSYDADASRVDVTLLDIDQNDGMIEVQDDGIGMDYETVTTIWLEPAHSHKADARKDGKRTKKGRLPVGEKGLGRFAVHRLGSVISMVTRSAGEDEVVVDIDWDTFLENEYLEQSEVEITTRKPEVFTGLKTGTRITISRLRQQWRRGEVRKLYRSVSSMTPPNLRDALEEIPPKYVPPPKKKDEEFLVEFIIEPDKAWLDGMFDPDLAVSQSLFHFDFILNDESLQYNYAFRPYKSIKSEYPDLIADRDVVDQEMKSFDFHKFSPAKDAISLKQRKPRDIKPMLGKGSEKIKGLGVGPIKGRIIGFDFDKEVYDRFLKDETGGLTDYVREQGGIRVYRDGLRVYSYGEPGDDWLHLDHRRIQGPTRRLGSRQLMGSIYLDLEESSGLIEKTNREGFVENEAYAELVHALLCVLAQFEAERNKDKRHLKKVLTLPPGSNNSITQKLTTEVLLDNLYKTVIREKAYKPLEPIVEQVTKAYHEMRDSLMSAAGAGMGLVTVFHELERGVRHLHQAIRDGSDLPRLQTMSTELVSLLKGAMYMVNTKQMETINASRLVEYVMLTQERRFKRHKITFLNGFEHSMNIDFEIHGIRRMLTTTLVNMLDNAIYWTDDGEGKEQYIWIGPSNELDGPAIVLADSGPGFIDEVSEIIQPFFTRKPSGMGIGLYYADMVMKSHSGRLAFPEYGTIDRPKVVSGACIAMVFNKVGKN